MYNPHLSYVENYYNGPTAEFIKNKEFPKINYLGEPKFSFLGIPLFIPFGVPAGPLLNSKYIHVALDAGFCLPIYKTVRSCFWESHAHPNVLKISAKMDHLEASNINRVIGTNLTKEDISNQSLSISNSFGVPSQEPKIWDEDFGRINPKIMPSCRKGFHVALSFQGSHVSHHDFYSDVEKIAYLAANTASKNQFSLLEINLSCPNESSVPIYKSLKDSVKTLKAAHTALSQFKNIKLIAKIGVMNQEELFSFMGETVPYIGAISAINTVSSEIVTENGEIALGSGSLTGGVCGRLILSEGLNMMHRLSFVREKLGLNKENFGLIGVGGVMKFEHYMSYINAGADLVQAATGMMWNLDLAREIAENLNVAF